MKFIEKLILGSFLVVLVVLVARGGATPLGSVSATNEYTATSTAPDNTFGGFTSETRIFSGAGTLGSVIITGVGGGIVNLYDATTTDVNKRTGQKATSTILVASFPANASVGTYTFDALVSDGLLLDLNATAHGMPTTTITYRR